MAPKRPHRVPTSQTRAFVGDDPLDVVNLSLGGARLEGSVEEGVGEVVDLLIRHPHLDAPAELRGRIVWANREGEDPAVGIKFVRLEGDPAKTALIRRCMLAEFGSTVVLNQLVIGYAVSATPGVWGFYDARVRKVGDFSRLGPHLTYKRCGAAPIGVPTAEEAARQAFGLDAPPNIDPPIELDSPPSSSAAPLAGEQLSGSKVTYGAEVQGFIAPTGQSSWSLYGPERRPLGFMTHLEGSPWRIVLLGKNCDGSLDLRQAESYPEAIAVAFGLEEMPQLTSAVFRPQVE